jgi:ATP-dependent protease HslVU (ClpYQ) peptidase subunit
MTCIAALVRDGQVWVAADTIAVTGDDRVWHGRTKIVRKAIGRTDEALMAACGDGVLTDLIRYDLQLPAPPDPGDDNDCNAWARATAAALTELAVDCKPPVLDDGHLNGAALLGHAGRLWYISQNSAHPVRRFTAIGSGGDAALGVLDVLTEQDADPEYAVQRAVIAACRYDVNCREPVIVEHLRLATP